MKMFKNRKIKYIFCFFFIIIFLIFHQLLLFNLVFSSLPQRSFFHGKLKQYVIVKPRYLALMSLILGFLDPASFFNGNRMQFFLPLDVLAVFIPKSFLLRELWQFCYLLQIILFLEFLLLGVFAFRFPTSIFRGGIWKFFVILPTCLVNLMTEYFY